jgi:hypothetical protein
MPVPANLTSVVQTEARQVWADHAARLVEPA